jgi:hypothetical protein
MCFVWLSEETATFALYVDNIFVFYNRNGEFTARYELSPYIKQIRFAIKELMYCSWVSTQWQCSVRFLKSAMVSLCLQANVEMIPKFPSSCYMPLM